MSRLLRVKLFKKGNPPAPSKTPVPKLEVVAVEVQQSPLASLPVEILLQIISYLTNAECFTLKVSGNRKIRTVLESRPKPSYEAYLRCLSKKPLSLPPDLQQVLNISASIGYEALLLKLLREELFQPVRGFAEANEGYLGSGASVSTVCEKLTPALEHAARFSQLAASKILLKNGAKNDNASRLYARRGIQRSALDWAATNGDMELVALLLKSGAAIRSPYEMPCAISYAAQKGHTDVVKLLIKKVHWEKGRRLSRPLAEAAKHRQVAMAEFLLDLGAKVEAVKHCSTNDNPLHSAARGGSVEIFRMILKKGAKDHYIAPPYPLGQHFPNKWCVWHFAAFYGYIEIIKVLLNEHHPIPDIETEGLHLEDPRDSVVITAVAMGHHDVVKELLERKFPARASIGEGLAQQSALHLAATKGDVSMMTLLLDHGADVNSEFGGAVEHHLKDRPLTKAAQHGSSAAISLLLDRRADIDAVNKIGMTALHVACSYGRTEAVACLLGRGARTGIIDELDLSATSCSVQFNQPACLVLLLEHRKLKGLNPVVDDSALHFAAESGRNDLVPLLLQHGAKLEAIHPRINGRPLHSAAFYGSTAIVEMLLSAGADPQARCDDGKTALHILISRGYTVKLQIQHNIVAMLLEAGLDINAVDGLGRTPLHIAGLDRSEQSFNMLVSFGAREDINDNARMMATDYLSTFTDGIGSG